MSHDMFEIHKDLDMLYKHQLDLMEKTVFFHLRGKLCN